MGVVDGRLLGSTLIEGMSESVGEKVGFAGVITYWVDPLGFRNAVITTASSQQRTAVVAKP